MKRRGKDFTSAVVPLKEELVLRDALGQECVRKEFISDVTGIPMEKIKSITMAPNFLRRGKRIFNASKSVSCDQPGYNEFHLYVRKI